MALTVRSRALGDSLIAVRLPPCGRIASRSLGKQEQPRTQIGGEIPAHALGLSHQPLASPGTLCHVSNPDSQTRSCAGIRWSGPELGTNLGTNSIEGEFRSGQLAVNNGGQGRD